VTFAVVCPGQGAQHAGMLALTARHPEGARVIAEAARVLGADPQRWLDDEEACFRNAVAQPLVCLAQYACWATLRAGLPVPAAFAGYSVGELSCYALAGAVDGAGLLTLARERAKCMDAAGATRPGGLVAVRGLLRPDLAQWCARAQVYIAIAVAEDSFVVGGTREGLAGFARSLAATRGTVTPLPVHVAAHTPLLAAAVAPFRAAVEAAQFAAPAQPVLAGVDAHWVVAAADAAAALGAQIATTVEWMACVDALYERGCRVFLELPPGRALARTIVDRHADVEARSVEDFRDPAAVGAWVRSRLP